MEMTSTERFVQRLSVRHPELLRVKWDISRDSHFQERAQDVNRSCFSSKFGGIHPYLKDVTLYPRCSNCDEKKTFLFQINLSECPREFTSQIDKDSGLFQLFRCGVCREFTDIEDVVFIEECDFGENDSPSQGVPTFHCLPEDYIRDFVRSEKMDFPDTLALLEMHNHGIINLENLGTTPLLILNMDFSNLNDISGEKLGGCISYEDFYGEMLSDDYDAEAKAQETVECPECSTSVNIVQAPIPFLQMRSDYYVLYCKNSCGPIPKPSE